MAVDIVIQETIDSVDITVNPNIIEVNVTRTSGGGGGSQNLQQVTDEGNTTDNDIIVRHSTGNEVIIESITNSSQISVNQGSATITLGSQEAGGVTEALIQMTSDKGYNIITEGAIQLSNSDNNTNIDLNDIGLAMSTLGVNQRINLSNGVDDVSIKTDLITEAGLEQQLPNKSGTFAMLDDVVGAVDSVNGQTGVVVLDADDIDDTSTTNKFTTAADISKLAGIEANADVTDSTNVNAAGAVMNSDYSSHSILVQQSGSGSPTSLQISNNTLVGRLSGGGSNINDLSVSDVKGLLNFTTPTDVQTIADAKVSDAIVDGVTTVAPSQNSVFDALALKQDILGYSPIKKIVSDTVSSSAVTGVSVETLCKTYPISANTFADGDFMKVLVGLEKTGVLGTATVRIRVNQTNNFATATLIGTYTPSAASHVAVLFKRDFLSFKSGVLKGINFNTSTQNDLASGASIVYNTTTLSPTSDFYIYVSVINTSLVDSTIVNQVQITN